MPVYHVTTDDHGENVHFSYQDCSCYEKFDDSGNLVQHSKTGAAIRGETPQLSASKSPEGAIFAVIKNLINATGDSLMSGKPTTLYIYEIQEDPDLDCTSAEAADFKMIEEVRFEEKEKFPIVGSYYGTVSVPGQASADVELAYLPMTFGAGELHTDWAKAVKESIENLVASGTYPLRIEKQYNVERPNIDEYY